MDLHGKNFIGEQRSAEDSRGFAAVNPVQNKELNPVFHEATLAEIKLATEQAVVAFATYRQKSGHDRARFLVAIAEEIEATGAALTERCEAETGLPRARLEGERGRTTAQLRLFADLLRDGHWANARIDTALPGRTPFPRPDIRSMQMALGPVAVFGASNFPLAFSVAGGDTASALAAGCSVVVKAHPAHPGTSEIVAGAISRAAKRCDMPAGVFNMVHGRSNLIGASLVQEPGIKALAFTGSLRGGRALFDLAVSRPEPIPVYAEMGSSNPVFILPSALAGNNEEIAAGLVQSLTLGAGQFCTNPGLIILPAGGQSEAFVDLMAAKIDMVQPASMLTSDIAKSFERQITDLNRHNHVDIVRRAIGSDGTNLALPVIAKTEASYFLANAELEEEVFGPATLLISAGSKEQMLTVSNRLHGHLTATIWGDEEELAEYEDLVGILQQKAGRIIFNGFPTGVEVSHAMVHGGPYPATTDSRTTSVGTTAIQRFARPVCFQNFPDRMLPAELQRSNPLSIWRLVDGEFTKST